MLVSTDMVGKVIPSLVLKYKYCTYFGNIGNPKEVIEEIYTVGIYYKHQMGIQP